MMHKQLSSQIPCSRRSPVPSYRLPTEIGHEATADPRLCVI